MKNLISAILLLASGACLSQSMRIENVNAVIEQVTKNNKTLQVDKLQGKLSDERLRTAWASVMPQVRAFGAFDNNVSLPVQLVPAELLGGEKGEYYKAQFGTRYNTAFGAEAVVSLVNLSAWKGISASSYANQASRHQYRERERQLTEQAINAYYISLLNVEAMKLAGELVLAADSLERAASARLKTGLIEPMEYNRVKALQLETMHQHDSYRVNYVNSHQLLKTLMGLAITDTIILSENVLQQFSTNSTTTSLTATTTAMPHYRFLVARQNQFAEELNSNRFKFVPELSLYARYMRQSFTNDAAIFSDQPWFDVGVIGLRADWILFSGFARQASIRQASLNYRMAEAEIEGYQLRSDRELRELESNHGLAASGLEKFRQHHALNLENYRIANEKYNQGVYTIDQYVNTYQEYVRSQNQYLSQLASFLVWQATIALRNTYH